MKIVQPLHLVPIIDESLQAAFQFRSKTAQRVGVSGFRWLLKFLERPRFVLTALRFVKCLEGVPNITGQSFNSRASCQQSIVLNLEVIYLCLRLYNGLQRLKTAVKFP